MRVAVIAYASEWWDEAGSGCYSGRIADERPVRFRLDGHEYLVEEVLDQWYGPQIPFTKSVQMTAISTSCAGKHRLPTDLGTWSRSGNCHARADLEVDRRQPLPIRPLGSETDHLQSSSGNMNVITGSPSSPGPETAFSVTSRIPSGPLLAVASILSFGHSAGSATMQ